MDDRDSWNRRIEDAATALQEQMERLRVARARIKERLRSEDREDALDELRCARDDVSYHQRLLQRVVSEAARERFPEERFDESEEKRFRSQPHEQARKRRLEREFGRSVPWNEYWAFLANVYEERAKVDSEQYSEQVRGYGWDFDSGNSAGVFPSDLGFHDHGNTVRREDEAAARLEALKKPTQPKKNER